MTANDYVEGRIVMVILGLMFGRVAMRGRRMSRTKMGEYTRSFGGD